MEQSQQHRLELGLTKKKPTVIGLQASESAALHSTHQYVSSVSDKLENMLTRHSLRLENIWNLEDETDFKPHPNARVQGDTDTHSLHIPLGALS